MPIFHAGSGPMQYETLGRGRPVVLIHGFTNYGLAWAPQLAPLVHAGYRVIVPDLHGHGASQPASGLCTVADLAADLAALLGHLGAAPAFLCGLSLGGMVAQQMALDRPDQVAGLLIANSRSSFSGPAMEALVEDWVALFRQDHGPVRRLEATWPHLVNASFRDSSAGRAAFDAWRQVLARLPGSSLSHVAQGMTRFDLRGRLAGIRVPALVVSGEHDRLFTTAQACEIAAEIAGAALEEIPGAGHISSMDSADRFNRTLLAFLATNAAYV